MAINYQTNSRIILETSRIKMIAIDSTEDYTTIRQYFLITKDGPLPIGAHFLDQIAGTHEWAEYNEQALAIFRQNRYSNLPPEISSLVSFDTTSEQTIQKSNSTQEQLIATYQRLFPESNRFIQTNDKKTYVKKA